MADWSLLPLDLLGQISQKLPTSTDVLRFRSVCAAWRASSPSDASATSRFPIVPNCGVFDSIRGFHLSERVVYSLQSPSCGGDFPWIIKLEADNLCRMHLVDPLAQSPVPLPPNFPKLFSFLDIRVREMMREYVLRHVGIRQIANSIGDSGDLYGEKVAVLKDTTGGFVVVTIHVSGRLAVCKSGDKRWRILTNDAGLLFDDVIFKQGNLYAVDHTGKTVVMNSADFTVTAVVESIYGGDKKYLVDSDGELLLVDKYLTGGLWGMDEDDVVESEWFTGERAMKFEVWKLNENQGKWEEVTDLGDRVLFLGENSTFSASVSEVFGDCSCWKNCIFFTDGVFSLESRKMEPIEASLVMFWPPPDWVYTASCSLSQSQ